MTQDTVIPLTKPISAHGEEITELTLREPTGKDIRVNGYPFTASGDGQIILIGASVCKYISTLAGIPASSVDALSATDFNALGWAVAGFFLKG